MFRFAWAYQNSGDGVIPAPHPVQTISVSVDAFAPQITALKSTAKVIVRNKIPVTRSGSGQLHIFVKK